MPIIKRRVLAINPAKRHPEHNPKALSMQNLTSKKQPKKNSPDPLKPAPLHQSLTPNLNPHPLPQLPLPTKHLITFCTQGYINIEIIVGAL